MFSFQSFKISYKPIVENLKKQDFNYLNMEPTIKSLETTINDNVYGKDNFISSYGYFQKLLDNFSACS